ncbi:MAG: DMT family transporter [Actinomycetota bacterium]|nr:DMT family transporter [Actinomycetota bacterium]MED5233563.1 DMT family transporter [Actinomycetota bacterium]MEE3353778.1 DMT family transporter [Actinomycetota bacterium]
MQTSSQPGDRTAVARIAAIGAVVCWSTGNVIVAQVDMSGLAIAFWRLVLGAVLYATVLHTVGRRITWAQVRLAVPVAITFALELGLFFTALHHTSVANATTIGSLQTIALMVVASVRFGERIGGWLIGIALVAIGGVAVVMFGGGADADLHLRGDLLALAAMVLFTAYFVVVKDVRARIDTFTLQTVTMTLGAVVLFPMAAIDAGRLVPAWPSWIEWGWLALLLAIPGTGHLLMNWAHLHVSLSLAGMLTLAIPALSALGAWLVLDQRLTVVQATGMAVVIASLVVVVRLDTRLHADQITGT